MEPKDWPVCPGCGQKIEFGECGGLGEGICWHAHYASELRHNSPEAAAKVWAETESENPPPSEEEVDAILAVHTAAGEMYTREEYAAEYEEAFGSPPEW